MERQMSREKRGPKALEAWARNLTEGYPGVCVRNMDKSWSNGLAFCALIHRFRPDLIEFEKLDPSDTIGNCSLAFEIAESKLGIPALLDPEDMAAVNVPDRLSILTYVAQYYSAFKGCEPKSHTISKSPKTPDKAKRKLEKNEEEEKEEDSLLKKNPSLTNSSTSVTACIVCQSPVYLSERLLFSKKLFHRTCFKCFNCKHLLNPHTAEISKKGILVCPQHLCHLELDKQERREVEEEKKKTLLVGESSSTRLYPVIPEDFHKDTKNSNSNKASSGSLKGEEPSDTLVQRGVVGDEPSDTIVNPLPSIDPSDQIVCDISLTNSNSADSNDQMMIEKPKSESTLPSVGFQSDIFLPSDENDDIQRIRAGDSKNEVNNSSSSINNNNNHIDRLDLIQGTGSATGSRSSSPSLNAKSFAESLLSLSDHEGDQSSLNAIEESASNINQSTEEKNEREEEEAQKETPLKTSGEQDNLNNEKETVSIPTPKPRKKSPKQSPAPSPTPRPRNKTVAAAAKEIKSTDVKVQPHPPTTSSSNSDKKLYPVDLNPFGEDDDEEEEDEEKSLPTSTISKKSVSVEPKNPFEDDEDDEEQEIVKEVEKKPSKVPVVVEIGKNPFEDTDDDDDEEEERVKKEEKSNTSSKTVIIKKEEKEKPVSLSVRKNRPAPPAPKTNNKRDDEVVLAGGGSVKKKIAPPAPDLLKGLKDHTNKAAAKQYRKKRRAPPPRRRVEPLPEEDIKREVTDLVIKERELERQGISLESNIRRMMDCSQESASEQLDEMMIQLWSIVNEKNEILRRQTELEYLRRGHRLEETQAEVEFQLRILMDLPKDQRQQDHESVEATLLDRLLKIVDERNEVVDWLDFHRQQDKEEDIRISKSLTGFFISSVAKHGSSAKVVEPVPGGESAAKSSKGKSKKPPKDKEGGEGKSEKKKEKSNKAKISSIFHRKKKTKSKVDDEDKDKDESEDVKTN